MTVCSELDGDCSPSFVAVRTKVLDIFNASCDYGREPGINLYTDEVYDFELGIGSTDTWPRFQGGDDPAVVEYEPFCGRYSLEVITYCTPHPPAFLPCFIIPTGRTIAKSQHNYKAVHYQGIGWFGCRASCLPCQEYI